MPVPLKGKHRVHHVLKHPWAGNRALLRNVAHYENGRAGGLCNAGQKGSGLAHLANAAGGGGYIGAIHCLYGVYYQKSGLNALYFGFYYGYVRFRKQEHVPARAQPLCAQLELSRGFFARNI